jgi:Ca2+-binding EF-hand superfamily protein
VIEFGRTLEAAWKKVPKDELDDIFRTLCKNNKESLTEEDLRNAFKNKEQSLISIPIVGLNDMLLPLFTKAIKRMRVQPAKIWETFNRSGKIGSDELTSMLGFYL